MRSEDLIGILAIAFVAFGGAFLADRTLASDLDAVRGMRVEGQAAAALESGYRDEGLLTIVQETESAKYPFLNKKIYRVNTESAARQGTALRGDVLEDQARAIRHAEARRKNGLKKRFEDGRWRVTIARGNVTVELVADPPKPPRPSAWDSAGLASAVGVVVLFVLRLMKRSPGASAVGGLIAAAVIVTALAESNLTHI
jgi:hypothetical protein